MVAIYVGITDGGWFNFLRSQPNVDECNFWQPRGRLQFRALQPGELFLFKLHSPNNFIVGGGVFTEASILPVSLAWEAFGILNGASSIEEMRSRIAREDFHIGCRVLTRPFFFDRARWIPIPESWRPQTQVGKTYRTDEKDGLRIWDQIQERLSEQEAFPVGPGLAEAQQRYGEPTLIAPRLGQGSFRIAVTDAYDRRCTFTGEKVLPALEAGHIRPYAEGGEHQVSNGLLLRRDLHTLFDRGYMTVTTDYRIEVSGRIVEEFNNGRAYYALHGQEIGMPLSEGLKPARNSLEWHNERFLG